MTANTIFGIGCALLEADDSAADFGVHITGEIDLPIVPTIRKTFASHKFLTKSDLCEPAATRVKVAELDDNGSLEITTGTERGVPTNEPDTIKVFARHDASGAPSEIDAGLGGLWVTSHAL